MWFGMLHLKPGESTSDIDGDAVLLMVWKPDWTRPITVVSPPDVVGSFIRLIRGVAEGGPIDPPRCDGCGTPIEVPDLDADLPEDEPCRSR
ncbi:MAG: hypothetical protein JHC95_12075 [Solirubrobacteraceae bacterium]|nr:hypothetical protein [Solirubrobacteraceae bacterium]